MPILVAEKSNYKLHVYTCQHKQGSPAERH
jgi:hypothetical protein